MLKLILLAACPLIEGTDKILLKERNNLVTIPMHSGVYVEL